MLTFPLCALFALATPPCKPSAIVSLSLGAPVADGAFTATTLLLGSDRPAIITFIFERDLLLLQLLLVAPTTLTPAHAAENDIAVAAISTFGRLLYHETGKHTNARSSDAKPTLFDVIRKEKDGKNKKPK